MYAISQSVLHRRLVLAVLDTLSERRSLELAPEREASRPSTRRTDPPSKRDGLPTGGYPTKGRPHMCW